MSIMGASRTLTSRERALYRASTGLVLAVMLFSIFAFVFYDHFPFPNGSEGAFVHLGFPPYFKVELTIAKILGVLARVIPAVPFKVKEFAYAGFAIVSAAIAHFGRGDAWNLACCTSSIRSSSSACWRSHNIYFAKSHSLQATLSTGASRVMKCFPLRCGSRFSVQRRRDAGSDHFDRSHRIAFRNTRPAENTGKIRSFQRVADARRGLTSIHADSLRARITSVGFLLIIAAMFGYQEGFMSQKGAGGIKNVVLVHGGFVDGSGWQGVSAALKKDGYTCPSSRIRRSRGG